MRVLIIEDNASLRRVLAALIVDAGHEVLAALPDGDALEDWLQRAPPDLVCLDYQLPGRDGLALLALINATLPTCDVLFMTASEDRDLELRAADAGASGFIRKPFGQAQILAELHEVAQARAQTTPRQPMSAPLASPAATPGRAAAPIAPLTPPGGSRRTAVIADDSGAVRMVLKGLLEEAGVRVIQAVANGADCVTAVRQHRPALVFLDVNMPIMGGLEALPKLREVCPEAAVIMVTGSPERALVTQAAALGAKGYIIKPLRPAYIANVLQSLR